MSQYLKAFYAAAVAGLGSTSTAYVAGGNHINFVSGIYIALATLTAYAAVWGVPNKPKS